MKLIVNLFIISILTFSFALFSTKGIACKSKFKSKRIKLAAIKSYFSREQNKENAAPAPLPPTRLSAIAQVASLQDPSTHHNLIYQLMSQLYLSIYIVSQVEFTIPDEEWHRNQDSDMQEPKFLYRIMVNLDRLYTITEMSIHELPSSNEILASLLNAAYEIQFTLNNLYMLPIYTSSDSDTPPANYISEQEYSIITSLQQQYQASNTFAGQEISNETIKTMIDVNSKYLAKLYPIFRNGHQTPKNYQRTIRHQDKLLNNFFKDNQHLPKQLILWVLTHGHKQALWQDEYQRLKSELKKYQCSYGTHSQCIDPNYRSELWFKNMQIRHLLNQWIITIFRHINPTTFASNLNIIEELQTQEYFTVLENLLVGVSQ